MKRILGVLFIGGLILGMCGSASATLALDTIAYTSFEEPGLGGKYYDPITSSHSLSNNSGEAIVAWQGSSEMGFTSYYTDTRGDVGLSDGDFVGVTDYTGDVPGYVDGFQGFQISDADGKMTVTLDTIDLSGYDYADITLSYFLNETGYESGDMARIWVEVNGGTAIDLINTTGFDIDDLGIEGKWNDLYLDLTGYTSATLKFEMDSNAAVETLYVDDVVISGSPVPVPGALWLLGSAGLAMVGVRRKNR